MKQQTRDIYRKTFEYYLSLYSDMAAYREETKRLNDAGEQADLSLVVRESKKLLEDMLKELGKLERQSQMIAGILWTKLDNVNMNGQIETEHCTAKPKFHTIPTLPTLKGDPEAFLKLTRHFGIPDEQAQNGTFRLHWPAVKAYLDECYENGKTPPPGINPDNVHTEYKLVCRQKKEILDNETNES